MMDYILPTILLIVFSFGYRLLAKKYGIIDKPNIRSSHIYPTIRGGGVIFYFAIIIFFISSGFHFPYFFIGLTLLAFISFLDDVFSLSVLQRLPVHFVAIFLALLEANLLSLPVVWVALLLFLGVVFINLYNFMDGINGMTGFYSFLTIVTFLFLSYKESLFDQHFLILILISIVIFGYFNFRKKAILFAGDVGSMTMAYIVFMCTLVFCFALNAPIILLLISVYIIDSGLTLVIRFFKGEKVTEPHREHLYERLTNDLGYPHLRISMVYLLIQALINLIVLFNYDQDINTQIIILLAVVAFTGVSFFFILKSVQNKVALKEIKK